MLVSPEAVEMTFDLIVEAARSRERCPATWPVGPLNRKAVTQLCATGRVLLEVFPRNFRRATVLDGMFAGLKTKGPPVRTWRAWRVEDADGVRFCTFADEASRRAPSRPRVLSAAEIESIR